MKFLLMTTLFLVPVTAHSEEATSPVAPVARQLKADQPAAISSLRQWIQSDPQSAVTMAFLGHHPNRARLLIDWALENPYLPGSSFNDTHNRLVDELVKTAPEGLAHLLAWARANPAAAKAMADSPYRFGPVATEALK